MMLYADHLMAHAKCATHDIRSKIMRTTLTIDDDVLAAVKARADYEGRSIGAVMSELLRAALRGAPSQATRNGLPILQRATAAQPVTLETIHTLRDDGA
jgi:hypothetical protein